MGSPWGMVLENEEEEIKVEIKRQLRAEELPEKRMKKLKKEYCTGSEHRFVNDIMDAVRGINWQADNSGGLVAGLEE